MATLYGGTLADLLAGPAYIYYADASVATKPTKLDDVIDLATPYATQTNWNAFGATSDASGGGRGFETEELEIEQQGVVLEKVTSTTRTLTVPLAEVTPETMQIVEVAPDPTTIAEGGAASGTPAQSRLDFGAISSLPRYRICLVAERDPGLGSSGEGGARGHLVGYCLYSAAVTAEDSDFEVGRGSLVGREVSFRAFPDPDTADAAKAHGAWIFETGATVP